MDHRLMKQDQIWDIKPQRLIWRYVKGRLTETKTSNEMELNNQKVKQNDTTMMIESTGTTALRYNYLPHD